MHGAVAKKISQNNFLNEFLVFYKILKSKSAKMNLKRVSYAMPAFKKNIENKIDIYMQFCNIQILSKPWNSKKHQKAILQQ